MLALKIESSQKKFDEYTDLLHERKKLEIKCREKMHEIDEKNIEKFDEMKVEAKMKIRHVLRDYIQQLGEKLELMMVIAQDVSNELFEKQSECLQIDEVLKVQEKALKEMNKKNYQIESETNAKILEIREDFKSKWISLNKSREDFFELLPNLENVCKKENELEKELARKRKENKRNLCCIKKIRRNAVKDENVTTKMIEIIQAKKEKYLKKCDETEKCLDYVKNQTCQLHEEFKITRRTLNSSLKITKLHDEWKTEMLLERKRKVTSELNELDRFEDDQVFLDLKQEIKSAELDVDQANVTIKDLKKLLVKFESDESCCKKIIRPSTAGKPKTSEKPQNLVLARDHFGSNFIAIQ